MKLFSRGDAPVADIVPAAVEDEVLESDAASGDEVDASAVPEPDKRATRRRWLVFRVMPVVALALAVVVGFLRWQQSTTSPAAVDDVIRAASQGAVAMLSYKPSTVEQDLDAAQSLLTGSFRDEYAKMAKDTVIPGSKKKQVSAVATVPAAGLLSIHGSQATALVFVDQSVIVGEAAPTNTHSSVRVVLDKVGDRWLISAFDPV